MTTRVTFVLAALLGAVLAPLAADDKSDAAKKDLDKLQGTWTFVSMERDGQAVPQGDPGPTITFDGDKFAVKAGDQVLQAGTQTVDPSKKPKAVDSKVTEGEGKGTTMLGIYEIDGDSLKACFDTEGKKRPTEFKTAAGSGHMLVVLKRAKK
jgi:uncharacterized protein (TIGR03067 family)